MVGGALGAVSQPGAKQRPTLNTARPIPNPTVRATKPFVENMVRRWPTIMDGASVCTWIAERWAAAAEGGSGGFDHLQLETNE